LRLRVQGRREESISGEKSLDSKNQIASGLRFLNITLRARFTNVLSQALRFVHGENQDAGSGAKRGDARSGVETAHARHGHVQDDDIRLQSRDGSNRFVAGGRLTADFPVLAGTKKSPYALPNDIVVVNDQNPG
jgi:hypothetical protein